MRRPILSFAALGFILMAAPLWAQKPAEQASVKALPGVVLPPQLDRVLRDYERAWSAGDAEALASLFAEDGFLLQSNAPPIRGRRAVQAAYQGQGGVPLKLRALAFAAGGTQGYIIGAYGYGTQSGDAGKFTLTLHRTPGGRWMIVSDMDNANAPPKPRLTPDAPSPPKIGDGTRN